MYNLPAQLKKLRSNLNLTQTQIAEKLGMTYQEYQKIENGKTVVRADKLYHICKTLEISSDWLLGLNTELQTYVSFAENLIRKEAEVIYSKNELNK